MIDKEALLKSALPEAEVEVPGRGTVRVRALTRAEALRLQRADIVEADVIALAAGLVDPALTIEEARTLVETSSATEVVQPIITAVMELSGLIEGAQKSGRAGADDG